MGTYTLVIRDGNNEQSFPILSEGFSLSLVAGSEGKHQTASCQLSVRGSEVLSRIMYAEDMLEARVLDDFGITIFTGVIRPYASVTANQMHMGNLSLEVLDYTEKMHRKVYAELDEDVTPISGIIYETNYDGCKICDPDNPDSSLVHILADLCGINVKEAPSIDVTLPRFTLEYGDYVDDVLADLLYEYVHDYRFDENGQMVVFQSGVITDMSSGSAVTVDLETEATLETFIDSLKISRSDDAKDGCVVTYPEYKTKQNVCLYEETASGWSVIFDLDTVWWSENRKKVTWNLSSITGSNGRDIVLSNFWIEYTDQSSGTGNTWLNSKSLSDCDDEGGVISFSIGAVGGFFFNKIKARIRVYADASYLADNSREIGYAGDNAESYTASYIYESEYALSLASAIRARCNYGSFQYAFSSFERFTPGSVVLLVESKIAGLYARARITSRTQSDTTGLFEYKAEGYDAAAFTEPEINKDNETSRQEEELLTFFEVAVSRETVSSVESDSTELRAVASGTLFSRYGATPSWTLNGTSVEGMADSSTILALTKADLVDGLNTIECSAEYEGETYTVRAYILLVTPSAQMLRLVASGLIFRADADGDYYDGQTIVLTAYAVGINGTIRWTAEGMSIADDTTSVTIGPHDLVNGSLAVSISAGGLTDSVMITTVQDGAKGVGVESITPYYLVSSESEGITIESEGWSTDIPVMDPVNRYLWSYEFYVYSDGTSTYTLPIVIGVYGDKGDTGEQGPSGEDGKDGADGVGIVSITDYYAVSASNSEAPSEWSTDVPLMTPSLKYLWNYEVITYTDGSTAETAKRVIGVYGDKGETGEDGTDGDVLSLSISGDTDTFNVAWYGEPDPADQSVTITAFSRYIDAANLSWSVSDGTLEAVSGDEWSRVLRVSTLSVKTVYNATSVKITVSGTTILGSSLSTSIWVTLTKVAMPAPIYCGAFSEDFTTAENEERAEGLFAHGDYLLYLGDSETLTNTDGSELSVNYGGIYEFDYYNNLWFDSVTAEHMFGALEDLFGAYEQNPDMNFSSISLLENILASNIATKNIVADMAKVTGKLQVTQIEGTSPDGTKSYELNYDHFYAGTNNGEDDDQYWELKSDGSGTIKNLDIVGRLRASDIVHDAVTTYDTTAFPGGDHIEKNFSRSLWNVASMWQTLLAQGYIEPRFRMATLSASSYGGQSVKRAGFGFSGMYPTTSLSDRTTASNITFGTYTFSYSVKAGNSYTAVAQKTNNYDYPVLVYIQSSLAGNWNWADIRIYNSAGTTVYDIDMRDTGTSYTAYFYLPAGYRVGVFSGSTAWFGTRTHSGTLRFAPSGGMPYLGIKSIGSASMTSAASSSTTWTTVGSVTIEEDALYFSAWWLYYTNEDISGVRLYYGGGASSSVSRGLNYASIPSSMRGQTVSVQIGCSGTYFYNSKTDHSGYNIRKAYVHLLYITTYDRAPVTGDMLMLGLEDGSTVDINPTYEDYRQWSDVRLTYEDVYESEEHLEKVSGSEVYEYLEENGFSEKTSLNSAENSSISIDGVKTENLVEVLKYSTFHTFLNAAGGVSVGKLGNLGDEKEGVFDSVILDLYPVSQEGHIKTMSVIPKLDNTYTLGNEEMRYRELHLGGNAEIGGDVSVEGDMTLGDSLNATTGYTVLPNGLLLQWGRLTPTSSSDTWATVTFPVAFSSVYMALVTMMNISTSSNAHDYIYSDTLRTTGFTTRLFSTGNGTRYTFWLAIGKP